MRLGVPLLYSVPAQAKPVAPDVRRPPNLALPLTRPAARVSCYHALSRRSGPLSFLVRAVLLLASVVSTSAVRPRTGVALNAWNEPEALDRAVKDRRSFHLRLLS